MSLSANGDTLATGGYGNFISDGGTWAYTSQEGPLEPPTPIPTRRPTRSITERPIRLPTSEPSTASPISERTLSPIAPAKRPTPYPTRIPSLPPTLSSTQAPTKVVNEIQLDTAPSVLPFSFFVVFVQILFFIVSHNIWLKALIASLNVQSPT